MDNGKTGVISNCATNNWKVSNGNVNNRKPSNGKMSNGKMSDGKMSDWIVKIEYKQKNSDGELETVVEKDYDFTDYTELIRMELMRIIMEVEDAFYVFSNNRLKEEWSDDTKDRFNRIRHKLLDQANAIKRLPDNLYHNGRTAREMQSGAYVAQICNSLK